MTQSGDILQIDTPENVTFDYDVAGIGSRFLSALVDTLLIALLQVIIFGAMILLTGMEEAYSAELSNWMIAVLGLASFVFLWGYYIFFELLWNGQSPGKRMAGLRVIRVDGMPVTAAEVLIRNLVRLIDFLPAAYGVGVVTMFVNEKSRRLGDLAAGTVVVRDRAVATLTELAGVPLRPLDVPVESVPVPEGFPLERMKERDLELIEEYLKRRPQLPNREALASQLLHSLYTRLGLFDTPARTGSADDALIAIYNAAGEAKRRGMG